MSEPRFTLKPTITPPTQEQIDVLMVIRQGITRDKKIAEALNIPERTVKDRLRKTYINLDVGTGSGVEDNKFPALAKAILEGYIPDFDK